MIARVFPFAVVATLLGPPFLLVLRAAIIGELGSFCEKLSFSEIRFALLHSFYVAVGSAFASTLMAFFVFAHRHTSNDSSYFGIHREQRRLDVFVAIPLLVPDLVLGVIYAGGRYTYGLPGNLAWLVVCYFVTSFPLAYWIISSTSAVRVIPLLCAARDLGASRWTCIRQILLPLTLPSMAVCGAIIGALAFNDFAIAFFVLSPGETTFPLYVYSSMRFGLDSSLYLLSAMLMLLGMAIATPVVYLAEWRRIPAN